MPHPVTIAAGVTDPILIDMGGMPNVRMPDIANAKRLRDMINAKTKRLMVKIHRAHDAADAHLRC